MIFLHDLLNPILIDWISWKYIFAQILTHRIISLELIIQKTLLLGKFNEDFLFQYNNFSQIRHILINNKIIRVEYFYNCSFSKFLGLYILCWWRMVNYHFIWSFSHFFVREVKLSFLWAMSNLVRTSLQIVNVLEYDFFNKFFCFLETIKKILNLNL